MYLTNLQVLGFKSFPDKLNLEFGPGITSVVGPNGCGKTNVAEAIRWALGEQSLQALRGDRLEDLIFSGSQNRKPLSMAEVSLVFSNESGILPIEYKEVAITRRMFRSGESEFFINKNPCRLKDITYLFLNTGMGAHAYSVIEQGMVENLLSDDPHLRRKLFEEAAGTAKYRVRRNATLRKLEATEADLLRLSDILREVERQRRALRRQVRRAEVFEKWKEQLKELEISLAGHEFARLAEDDRSVGVTLANLEGEQATRREKVTEGEAKIEDLKQRLVTQEAELGRLRAVFDHYREEARRLESEIRVRQERRISSEREGQRIEEEIGVHLQQLDSLQQSSRRLNQELEQLLERTLAEEIAEQEQEKELLRLDESLMRQRVSLEELRKAVQPVRGAEEDQRHSLAALRARRGTLQDGGRRLASERRVLEGDGERISAGLKETSTALEEMKSAITLREEQRQRLVKSQVGLGQAKDKHQEEQRRRQQEFEIAKSELDILRGIQERYEDYGAGVRTLMGASDQRLPGIHGVLANLIEVPGEWIHAIEAALGESLECVVVESLDCARQAIEYLRDGRKGRVHLLPLDILEAEHHEVGQSGGMVAGITRASDLVRCDPVYRPVVDHLLDDVLVVRDISELMAVLRENKAGRIVTRQGEMWERPGILRGGADPDEVRGLLGKRERIASLNDQMERLSREIGKRSHHLALLSERIEKISSRLKAVEEALRAQEGERDELERRLSRLSYEDEALRDKLSSVLSEECRLASEAALLDVGIVEAEHELEGLTAKREVREQSVRVAERELGETEQKRQEGAVALNEVRIRLTEMRAVHTSLRRELARAEEETAEIIQTLERKREARNEVEQGIHLLQQEMEEIQGELESLTNTQDGQAQEREKLKREGSEFLSALEGVERENQQLRRVVEAEQERVHALHLRRSELSLQMKHLTERIRETYDPAFCGECAEPAESAEPFDPSATQQMIENLRNKLKRAGAVNLLALQEYREIDQRHQFLCRQQEDLVAAKDDLRATIVKIDEAARAMFLDTFGRIRQGFASVFSRLMPGGEADLELIGDDPLEAEIAILARPEGKRLRSIDLLSGGEKALTAISLLMGVYLTKPAPFCILDEIDAPLDDANLGRFLDLLREFSQKTQFVIITHNKRTMESADTLYGVTMQEPGVSRVVSVRFNQREKTPERETVGTPADRLEHA